MSKIHYEPKSNSSKRKSSDADWDSYVSDQPDLLTDVDKILEIVFHRIESSYKQPTGQEKGLSGIYWWAIYVPELDYPQFKEQITKEVKSHLSKCGDRERIALLVPTNCTFCKITTPLTRNVNGVEPCVNPCPQQLEIANQILTLRTEDEVRAEERKRIGEDYQTLYRILDDFEWKDKNIKIIILPRLQQKIDLLMAGKSLKEEQGKSLEEKEGI